MNTNVLNKITYGLYVLSSKHHNKVSGCIIDACIQADNSPDLILISVMNSNYTAKIIDKSKVFCISVLTEKCPFELIKHFGYQSGRVIDKFERLSTFTDINGVPCILSCVCATISCKVIDRISLPNHTIFIGKVKDQKHLNNDKPMTYAYYQEHIKPKIQGLTDVPDGKRDVDDSDDSVVDVKIVTENVVYESDDVKGTSSQNIVGWRCTICGFVYNDANLPDDYTCDICGYPATDFVPIYSTK